MRQLYQILNFVIFEIPKNFGWELGKPNFRVLYAPLLAYRSFAGCSVGSNQLL